MKPLVSIIIPAFNEEETLPDTIKSIRKSIEYSGFTSEIIVVDNYSEDETFNVAKKLADVVFQEKKKVISIVRNKGAKNAKGKFLIFIDADTLIPREAIKKIVGELASGAVVVGCKIMPHPLNFFEKLVFGVLNFILQLSAIRLAAFSGNCVGYKKNVFDQVSGFDTERVACEDHDLSNRVAKHGRAVFLNDLVVLTSNRRVANLGLLLMMLEWAKSTIFYIFGIRRKKYKITR